MRIYIWIKKISMVSLLALAIYNVQAQDTRDTTASYLHRLATSNDPGEKAILKTKLQKLSASDKEQDMMLAANIYYSMKKNRISDSLQKAIVIKFPLGVTARGKAEQTVYDAKKPEVAVKAYNQWIAKFPPKKFPNENHDHIVYDYARSHIAQLYAKEGNIAEAKKYINMLEEEFWKGNAYGGLSAVFQEKGDLANAEVYAKKAMENAKSFLGATDNAGKFAASGYPGLCNTYVDILYKEKKYNEALKYIDTVYKLNKTVNSSTNFTYAKLLIQADRNKEAYDKMGEVMKTGKASSEMDSLFKKLYLKVNGSYTSYEDYMEAVNKTIAKYMREKLKKGMMDKPAPLFTLTNLNGKKVSLEQFKGKVVILDFWATWCGPCKRSFPAMQMAQDKYKDDPNVKFLFIHTWERNDQATEDAKAFIKKHHYSFEVLMDLKDPQTKQNKVVSSYGVTGIPAKFVIDPKGNIRFKLTGFEGSDRAAVNEISMMIELAKKEK